MYKTIKVEESTHSLLFSAKRFLERKESRELNTDIALKMILAEFWNVHKSWRLEEK